MRHTIIGFAALMSSLTIASISHAQVPNTFVAGDAATAAEVNANFTNLDGRVTSAASAANANAAAITATEIVANGAASIAASNTTAINTATTVANGAASVANNAASAATTNAAAITTTETVANNAASAAATNATAITTAEGTLTTLDSSVSSIGGRVDTLEAASVAANLLTIAVDCASESLNDAIIDAGVAEHLIVNITGTCSEEVIITRSGVSLVGPASIEFVDSPANSFHDSIDPDGDLLDKNATVSIIGAQNVIVDNLTISDGAGAGIYIGLGSSALITDTTLEGNGVGLIARLGGTAVLKRNTIQANIGNGVWATDGGILLFQGDNTITQAGGGTALGVYRNGTVYFTGTNTITSDTKGLEIYYGSQIRAEGGLLTVNAALSDVGYDSHINFRDVAHTGDINVNNKGTLRLQNNGSTTVGVSVMGNINVDGLFALFTSNTDTTVTGDVSCNANSTSIASYTGVVTGTVSADCN